MRDEIGRFVGSQVAARRHAMRWSQGQLAERVGVSRVSISMWESGVLPSLESLYVMAGVFGIEPQQLLPTRKQVKA